MRILSIITVIVAATMFGCSAGPEKEDCPACADSADWDKKKAANALAMEKVKHRADIEACQKHSETAENEKTAAAEAYGKKIAYLEAQMRYLQAALTHMQQSGVQAIQLVDKENKRPPLALIHMRPEAIQSSPHYPSGAILPSTSNIVVRPAFTTSMNFRTKTPDWVAELLTAELVNGKGVKGERPPFKSDSDIPQKFTATNEDYTNSGWSRGHLAASASHKSTQDGQDSTFLLNSNIVPQDMSMNGCDWNRLEVLVRDLTNNHPKGKVFVLSGPVWIPESNTEFTQRPFSKNKVIMHEVVGEHNVHVPTHMFKVIRVEDESESFSGSVAFVMPNRPIAKDEVLDTYITSFDDLERQTGLDLSGMRTSSNLCTLVKCNRSTNHRMLGWRHYGFIDEAMNIEELRSAVRNAIDAGFVDGDNFLIPKAVRDRMRDLKLGDDPATLFPDEQRYQQAVRNGLDMFNRKSGDKTSG